MITKQSVYRRIARVVCAAGVMAVAACGDSTSPKPNLSGEWEGVAGTGRVALSLVDNNGSITGTGTLPARTVTVSGTLANSTVQLTLSSATGQPISFSGFYRAPQSQPQQLDGTLAGSGFLNEPVTLFKR